MPQENATRGVVLTTWVGDNMATAIDHDTEELIAEARPTAVSLHAGLERLEPCVVKLADQVHKASSATEIHLGVGCDYWIEAAARGKITEEKAVERICVCIDLAKEVSACVIVLDAEAACKLNKAQSGRILCEVVRRIRAALPYVRIGITAYDQPGQHGKWPWDEVLGGESPAIDWFIAQTYIVIAPGKIARGGLPVRTQKHRASWAAMVKQGRISPKVVVDAYLQAYSTPVTQLVTAGCEWNWIYFWCAPKLPRGRMDANGTIALRASCELERRGFRKPGGIREFQAASGLVVDGVVGEKTLGALGID